MERTNGQTARNNGNERKGEDEERGRCKTMMENEGKVKSREKKG
ncbi:MAG: hypothetical protein PUF55_02820 [Bacteroidales bacterium]|nr:hypothetical protein [Bacteroidales bacterium]